MGAERERKLNKIFVNYKVPNGRDDFSYLKRPTLRTKNSFSFI